MDFMLNLFWFDFIFVLLVSYKNNLIPIGKTRAIIAPHKIKTGRYDTVRYGTIRYDTIRYDTILDVICIIHFYTFLDSKAEYLSRNSKIHLNHFWIRDDKSLKITDSCTFFFKFYMQSKKRFCSQYVKWSDKGVYSFWKVC